MLDFVVGVKRRIDTMTVRLVVYVITAIVVAVVHDVSAWGRCDVHVLLPVRGRFHRREGRDVATIPAGVDVGVLFRRHDLVAHVPFWFLWPMVLVVLAVTVTRLACLALLAFAALLTSTHAAARDAAQPPRGLMAPYRHTRAPASDLHFGTGLARICMYFLEYHPRIRGEARGETPGIQWHPFLQARRRRGKG